MKSFTLMSTFLFCNILFGQTLKLSSGVFFTNIKVQDHKILKDNATTVPVFLGIDYLDKGNFYLSSEIGYISVGSSGDLYTDLDGTKKHIKECLKILQFNTTFRYRVFKDEKTFAFIGLGPKIDYFVDDTFSSFEYSQIDFPKVFFGLKSEAGIAYHVDDRISLGLNFNYYLNIERKEHDISYKYNDYGFTASVGYKF